MLWLLEFISFPSPLFIAAFVGKWKEVLTVSLPHKDKKKAPSSWMISAFLLFYEGCEKARRMRATLRVMEWKIPRHSKKLLIERGLKIVFTKSFALEISKKLRYLLFEAVWAKKNNLVSLIYLNLNAMPTSPGGSFPLTTPSNSFTLSRTCFCYNLRKIWKIDGIKFHAVSLETPGAIYEDFRVLWTFAA